MVGPKPAGKTSERPVMSPNARGSVSGLGFMVLWSVLRFCVCLKVLCLRVVQAFGLGYDIYYVV